MTMMSFRVDPAEALEAQRRAEELGVDKSKLLRDALHRHLVHLSAEQDIAGWADQPLSAGEDSIGLLADWGPAQDWADWTALDSADRTDSADGPDASR